MKEFTYKVTDPEGLHARPAGLLVKKAATYSSDIFIKKDDKSGSAKKIFTVMGLGVKCGQEVTIMIEGEDEEKAYEELQEFFKEQL